jgi:hypothetical protein
MRIHHKYQYLLGEEKDMEATLYNRIILIHFEASVVS